MKRTKLLALTLVVAIMLTGAGYALWNDTLYVESTVNTGHLDVDFTKVEKVKVLGFEIPDPALVTVKHSVGQDTDFSYGDHENFDEANPMSNRDKVIFTLENFYPSAVVTREVTVKNTGSVPVKISRNKFKPITIDVPNAMSLNEVEEDDIEITVEAIDENEKSAIGLNSILTDYYVPVGKEMSFIVTFKFNSNSGNNTEHKTYKYQMELPFEQGTSILK